jgi:hypothetical protein
MKEAHISHRVAVHRQATVAAAAVAVYLTVATNQIQLHLSNSGNRMERKRQFCTETKI